MGDPAAPGYASIVLESKTVMLVTTAYLGVFINITDDSIVTHESPAQIDQPI